jgi:hypothetical protein
MHRSSPGSLALRARRPQSKGNKSQRLRLTSAESSNQAPRIPLPGGHLALFRPKALPTCSSSCYALLLSQSNNWWLRSTLFKVVIWGMFILGLLLTFFARSRQWSGWRTWPGYALLLLAPLWLIAGLITGVAQIGRGRPVFVYNMLDLERFRWSGPSLSAGKHTVVFDFKYDGPGPGKSGTGVLSVDGKEADRKTIPHSIPLMMTIDETFDIGLDTRSPVDFSYDVPFRFNGTINRLNYKLGPEQLAAEDQKKVQDAVANVNN